MDNNAVILARVSLTVDLLTSARVHLNHAILATPTSNNRNDLADANIHLIAAQDLLARVHSTL